MEPKDTVKTFYFKGFTNEQCEFYPCHVNVKREFNCLYCYCPLIFLKCIGPYKVFTDKHGNKRKDCSNCIFPHDGYKASWNFIQKSLKKIKSWSE